MVDLSRNPAGVTVTVAGDLDLATARSLTDAVRDALDEPIDAPLAGPGSAQLTLDLDLNGIAFCDSVGIGALVQARHACAERGWALRLVRLQPGVRRVLEFAGLSEYLDVR